VGPFACRAQVGRAWEVVLPPSAAGAAGWHGMRLVQILRSWLRVSQLAVLSRVWVNRDWASRSGQGIGGFVWYERVRRTVSSQHVAGGFEACASVVLLPEGARPPSVPFGSFRSFAGFSGRVIAHRPALAECTCARVQYVLAENGWRVPDQPFAGQPRP
jgi:hypothetical protein